MGRRNRRRTGPGHQGQLDHPGAQCDRRHAARPDGHAPRHPRRQLQVHLAATGPSPAPSATSTRKARWRSRIIGPYGGTAFALPIDYDTDRYDATAAYTTPAEPGVAAVHLFAFHDNNSFVTLPYPFSNTAAPYQQSAAYSTPPSNSAHYVTLMAATNALPNTRINLNLRVGLEMQDDTFPPNTADPNLGGHPWIGNLNPDLQGTSASSLQRPSHGLPGQGQREFASDPQCGRQRATTAIDGRSVSLNQYKVYSGGTGGESDATFTSLLLRRSAGLAEAERGRRGGVPNHPRSTTPS